MIRILRFLYFIKHLSVISHAINSWNYFFQIISRVFNKFSLCKVYFDAYLNIHQNQTFSHYICCKFLKEIKNSSTSIKTTKSKLSNLKFKVHHLDCWRNNELFKCVRYSESALLVIPNDLSSFPYCSLLIRSDNFKKSVFNDHPLSLSLSRFFPIN